MAMTLRLDEDDDRRLAERARLENRSKQAIVHDAVRAYLQDEVRRVEDLEDDLALARFRLREQLGETRYVSQADARAQLGLG